MAEEESLEDNIAVFKKIVSDLKMLEVKYNEEDLALILLCSLSGFYASFRDTIEKLKHLVRATSRDEETLVSHGKRRGRLKNNRNLFCFYCKLKGHFRKDCDKLQVKGDLAAYRGVQSSTSDETNAVENFSDEGLC
ncbi:uncharacterized protein LOC111386945 [Olea europaea var. sylvestris]|uniref:uncharacterized protein LOC111386945 n=1 Tax=Olea europaea var. sylvestris TaxID=158386 RepID=UPI000C1D5935|nr:uncharacterized protein LOC111386945 [Olea europaea var. sylvestris]